MSQAVEEHMLQDRNAATQAADRRHPPDLQWMTEQPSTLWSQWISSAPFARLRKGTILSA